MSASQKVRSIQVRQKRGWVVRALKDVLVDLEKSGLTLEQQLLLIELIAESRRIAIWRDMREIDEILHWLRKECTYSPPTPLNPSTFCKASV